MNRLNRFEGGKEWCRPKLKHPRADTFPEVNRLSADNLSMSYTCERVKTGN